MHVISDLEEFPGQGGEKKHSNIHFLIHCSRRVEGADSKASETVARKGETIKGVSSASSIGLNRSAGSCAEVKGKDSSRWRSVEECCA